MEYGVSALGSEDSEKRDVPLTNVSVHMYFHLVSSFGGQCHDVTLFFDFDPSVA